MTCAQGASIKQFVGTRSQEATALLRHRGHESFTRSNIRIELTPRLHSRNSCISPARSCRLELT